MIPTSDIKVIKHFTYRSVRAVGGYDSLTLPRSVVESLEILLADMHGCQRDNHVCYLVSGLKVRGEDRVLAVMFSDSDCVVGTTIAQGDCENHDVTKYTSCPSIPGDFAEKDNRGDRFKAMEARDFENQIRRQEEWAYENAYGGE